MAKDNAHAPSELGNIAHTFLDFNNVKDKIIMTVVNTEKNREMLAGMPHKNREDLSLIYKVSLGNDEMGMATIAIKNEHMEAWGVTAEEIHNFAMENSKELLPVTVQSMNEIMREMFGRDGMPDEMAELMFEEMPTNQQMYVISNQSKINGAAAMFYEDALSGLADQMGTDLFILPSSVHEVIAVSADMGTPESLAEMVREVNGGEVAAEEQLSDHVYRYDAVARSISLAKVVYDDANKTMDNEFNTYTLEEYLYLKVIIVETYCADVKKGILLKEWFASQTTIVDWADFLKEYNIFAIRQKKDWSNKHIRFVRNLIKSSTI